MAKEKNTLNKRVTRYAKVSKAMAGVGLRAAGQRYLGISTNRQEQAERLRLALGGLKGPLMKVAQILSTIPDAVPPEYAAELSQLQSDAPSMGWPFVKRRMTAELGPGWENKFREFNHEASAAASLGQVHRAVSLDGSILACKLQYPDMEATVQADLKQLQILMSLFEYYDRAVSTKKIQLEIADRLREELNYHQEAKHIDLYRIMLDGVDSVHIPEVVRSLSTNRLLSMTWLDGQKLVDVIPKRKLKDHNAIAINMFHAWYTPFYHYGVIHGDPHLGNYTICKNNDINLLDFGCIRIFRPEMVQGVIMLYNSLYEQKPDLAIEAYKMLGFSNPGRKLVDILNIWAQFIYAPILQDKTRLIEETNTGLYGRETANKVHNELRKIGGVEVPREFVFMDRAAVGLGSVFLRLRAEINWYRVFQDLIKDFDAKKLAVNQGKAIKSVGLA